jgi:hypothetical protein
MKNLAIISTSLFGLMLILYGWHFNIRIDDINLLLFALDRISRFLI